MNKKGMMLLYIRSVSLALRVGVFEQFGLSAKIVWSALIFFLAMLGYVVSIWVAVAILLFGVLFYKKIYSTVLANKYRLLRKGDLVEYMVPDESSMLQEFRRGEVRHRLDREELAATKLLGKDQTELYEQFFLVDAGEKNIAIPFEWIMGIEFTSSPL